MTDMLRLNGVSKTYPEFTLKDISFTLPEGYIMGLIGPNGSGKTTTVRLILNMIACDTGEISLLGMDNIKDEIEAKQQIGVVFDSAFYVDDWYVRDVEKAIAGFYIKWDSERYASLLRRFDLSPGKKIKELSRGMRMKLMLAGALAHDARLLILDEPTSGLDPLARAELLDILQEYIQDGRHSALFSTHITTDLERVADYITFLHNGKMLYSGSREDFTESRRVVKGKLDRLTDSLNKSIIGLRVGDGCFDGLIMATDALRFSGCVIDRATIDDIMVYTGREDA